MKMAGIIFSNIYDTSLGELTQLRTVASLPFGGRYRLVDFVLSNMVNSDISSIGIITKYNYQSLMDHLGPGMEWDLTRKNAGLHILPPYVTGGTNVYRGNLEALSNAVSFLTAAKPDYVVMCDTANICNIQFKDALESHVESGAHVTIIGNKSIAAFEKVDSDVYYNFDKKGRVCDMAIGKKLGDNCSVGMGMYILERRYLLKIISEYVSRGRYSFEKDFLLECFNKDVITINAFDFKGPVLRNHNTLSYFKNNFRLMEEDIRKDIFSPKAPIYTRVRDEVPAYYSENSKTEDSVVADGCYVSGAVENSVLFRNVTVENDAVVKKSVIMQGTTVGTGAKIENAIIDKDVTITPGTVLVGSGSSPIVIHKGETI